MTIGTQAYPWFQHLQSRGLQLMENLDEVLIQASRADLKIWEAGGVSSESEARILGTALRAHGFSMPSLYLGECLHQEQSWMQSVDQMLMKVDWCQNLDLGLKIITVNPDPIQWGTSEDKTDDQLHVQAKALGGSG